MDEQPNPPMLPPAPQPIYRHWMAALTRPSERTFAEMTSTPAAKASTGYLWYFVASLVQTLLLAGIQSSTVQTLFSQYTGQQVDMGNPLIAAICGAPFGAVLSTVFFAIGAAIFQWIAGLFGGRGNVDRMTYALSAILTPYLFVSAILTLLTAVPYVGPIAVGLVSLIGLYILVLEVMAVKGVNGFEWWKAIVTLLVPVFVIGFVCACLISGTLVLLGPVIRDTFDTINQSLQGF